eukprot:gnl/MRDRNA2_/MRDRNA2_103681_c0_seq1.p1 gnl/MRDRNA2_/MRDRNA2_103681_c0~~gnl/MRDRNA2_/MRDRNA2_103681_c0_seq1.p1  ORF type:complete len:385 (+),score=110.56 gnl/MRDRNA2_/MRDRNA2_103681_c0_seq1:93-1247(+)
MDGPSSSDAMACTWSSLTQHDISRHHEMIKRRMKTDAERKTGLRKFYDGQVAEKAEKNRFEIERQKQYAKEEERERDLWQKMCDSKVELAKKKAMEEKELRDAQVVRAQGQKLARLEQEVHHHVQLMERLGQEGEKNRKAEALKASQRVEFFQKTRAEATELNTTRKELAGQQRTAEASAVATYIGLVKKYDRHIKDKSQAKALTHRDQTAQIRKERAVAKAESQLAAMKLDMEEMQVRYDNLDREEKERLSKAKELRCQTQQFVRKQISEKQEQQKSESQARREPPQPIPADEGFGVSTKLISRDLATARAWDFARSEDQEKSRQREMRLQHKKDLEAQISARGRPLPGLNLRTRHRVEPELSPQEMSMNKKLIDEMATSSGL